MTDRQLVQIVDNSIKAFRGDTRKLSNAIGYLFLGRKFGWRVMLLMHDRKSIRDYEKILGISSREFFPELGPMAGKSLAYRAVQKVSNFWKAVRGEIPGVRSTELR